MRDHIVKSYDQELSELTGKISDIGRMSSLQLQNVLEAFENRDASGARRIIDRDSAIDHLELDVNRLTVHMLASRQPLAVDLRTIISALKIATDMERIADYAVNIARQLLVLNGKPIQPDLHSSFTTMMEIVQDMLSAILAAYTGSDVEKALAVWKRDKKVDQMYSGLLNELRTCMTQDNQYINSCTALLFIARCLERIGDHIKNIAEDIYFIVTGELYEEEEISE
jgi:phosphate transport system protein